MENNVQFELIYHYDLKSMEYIAEGRSVYYTLKRIMDIVLASISIILLLPVMLLVALLIKLYSPGPIFFAQERVGARRRYDGGRSYWKQVTFRCYKFRTMRVNSDPSIHQAYVKALMKNDQEEMSAIQGQVTSIRKLIRDPRITRPGRLLRKMSIDELPQLWNVLRGEMSLVGPRPAIPYEVELYEPWYLGRLAAKPGITGLQQVTARSTVDFEQQMRLDVQYVENQSLFLDLKIMLKTPFVILSTKGAQ